MANGQFCRGVFSSVIGTSGSTIERYAWISSPFRGGCLDNDDDDDDDGRISPPLV